MLVAWLAATCWCLAASARACDLSPGADAPPKSPGDNFYRLIVNGEVERYEPGQRYVVTLVGSRTHDVVQQFTQFQIVAEPLDPALGRATSKQGQFQLFADTLSKFDDECINSVVEADDLPKTEVQVMWKAPPPGQGCVLLKAMVYENESRWFAEDGQLTKRICEDTAHSALDCCACDDAKYKMVFQGLWSPQTHPKDFPTQAMWLTHFSDIIGATHPKNFTFWGEGEIASDGFRSLAEWGSVGLMERELRQRGRLLRSVVKAQGLWHPHVTGNTSGTFTVDRRRPYLSLASMFGPSPDWVVGVSGLDLCLKNCTWVESMVVDLFPYDAGTDSGISYMSPNSETVPRERMYRISPMYPEDPRAPFYSPAAAGVAPMARLHLARGQLLPRSCDERQLQAQLDAGQEEPDDAAQDRPECAVSEWSAWSACSVPCGKGLRMRTRTFALPQKAAMLGCQRQLVGKEMCVAAVPECEADNAAAEEEPAGAVAEGACRTGAWGEWTECSVTCGVGVSVRRRHFLDHSAIKKCPLVQVEESRKCMEPQCTEQEVEVADPTCPTTPWTAWSPCSATCGRGVRFSTRLLLVPADRQQACASRIELLRQRTCSEKDDCTLDMLTAKRVCMEAPQQGPCSAVHQRWAFAPQKGMCVPFTYGGCRGNQNNFISQEDCMNTCKVVLAGGAPGPAAAAAASANSVDGAGAAGDCVVSAWGEWGQCSVSCGTGYQQRNRSILTAASAGGAPCPPRLAVRRRCSRHC